MSAVYEVQVLGAVDEASMCAFLDLQLDGRTIGPLTIVSGELDEPGLHGLLERIRVHHLVLAEVRRVRRVIRRGD